MPAYAEMQAGLELSSSLNRSQTMSYDYYNWCTDYPTAPVIWSAISAICFLVGFPSSVCFLYKLIQKQRMRPTTDVFLLSLAIIDLIFTAQIPFSVCNFMIWHSKNLEVLLNFIYSLDLNGRPLFMACMCWDCYVAVIHPIVYKTSMKLILVKKAITVTIFITLVVAAWVMCTKSWLATTAFMAFPLIVALPVIFFCDISVLRSLRKPDPTGKAIHPQKKQALYTISNSFIMTVIVYLPPVIIFSFGQLIPLTETSRFCNIAFSGFCFITAGCVITPVLYLVSVCKLETLKKRWKK